MTYDRPGFAGVLDLRWFQGLDPLQAQAIEFAHGELIHDAGVVEAFCRLMNRLKDC